MNNRVVLVTGGISGIGSAICKYMAKAGYTVVANHLPSDQEKAQQWQESMRVDGFNVELAAGDVSNYESVGDMMAKVTQDVGPIDVLVNNAGITRDSTLRKMSPQDWAAVIDINLTGNFNCSKHIIEGMLARGYGRIINISSVNGQKGQFGQTNYSAAKAGVHGFTKALAQEVARKGVTVNTISPGYIATERVMAVDEQIRQSIVAQIPVGRLGEPEEIARTVAFLAADEAGFITGSNIAINGGQHMF